MPLHAEDILADVARMDLDGIEEAFRALVGWPGTDTIVKSDAAERRALLADTADALIDAEDARIMPGDTFTLILDEAEDMDGSTYADGARAVLRCDAFFDNLDREDR